MNQVLKTKIQVSDIRSVLDWFPAYILLDGFSA
jgi:hypothetical protein